jgi:hypothetical protein
MTTFLVNSQTISPKEFPKQCDLTLKSQHLFTYNATMAMITNHHWPYIPMGLAELRRLTKGPVIIMTFDPAALDKFWNAKYFPELIEGEKAKFPQIELITNGLRGNCKVTEIPIPLNCADGFQEAFLQKELRLSQSAWVFFPKKVKNKLVKKLHDDLKSREWDKKYGHFRTQPFFSSALRLIVSIE